MGGGDEVPRDHNAPKRDQARRLTSEKEGIRRKGKKEGAQCHDRGEGAGGRSTYGLNAAIRCPQFNPKPSTPKTSLLAGVQVKEEKGKRAEVARTHMEEVTKGEVNSMGKRKQHSKHRKRHGSASI
ncbi:hypothetical protein CK203_050564 [Vitis vinifera]|uniref:Uncharacterized protein n=1 Tax=Vitis vinifera TaxID=29760 RepID=A0A438GFH7_VITVI|nr:hypothetical protein CK203_050564 [Vitis vinifera]